MEKNWCMQDNINWTSKPWWPPVWSTWFKMGAGGSTSTQICWSSYPSALETNTNWRQQWEQSSLGQVLRQYHKGAHLRASSAQTREKIKYQPRGTAMWVTNNRDSWVQKSWEDPHSMGRWSWIQLTGKIKQQLTIITPYQVVCNTANSADERSARMQQWLLLWLKDRNEDPRIAFWKICMHS